MAENNNIKINDLNIRYDENGDLVTNDPRLNDIVREVEEEYGAKLVTAVPVFSSIGPDPTTKVYLILSVGYSQDKETEGNEIRDWEIVVGRQETYDRLKNLIQSEAIDPHVSFVLSGETAPEEAITVFRFMKYCQDGDKVVDNTSFDINEYAISEVEIDKTILDV